MGWEIRKVWVVRGEHSGLAYCGENEERAVAASGEGRGVGRMMVAVRFEGGKAVEVEYLASVIPSYAALTAAEIDIAGGAEC